MGGESASSCLLVSFLFILLFINIARKTREANKAYAKSYPIYLIFNKKMTTRRLTTEKAVWLKLNHVFINRVLM